MLSVTYKPFMLNVITWNVIMLRLIMLSVTYKPFTLTVIMLSVIMLNAIMLCVIMLNVIMMNAVMPHKQKLNKTTAHIFTQKNSVTAIKYHFYL